MVFHILKAPKPKTLEQRLDRKMSERGEAPVHYAVLFNSSSHRWYRENLTLANDTVQSLGYRPEDIFILDTYTDNSPPYSVADIASRESLGMILKFLSETIREEDGLFLYMTGHGDRRTKGLLSFPTKSEKISTVPTPKLWRDITELDVANWTSKIHPRSGVLLFDQCYSGGFASRTGTGNYVSISACEADGKSYLTSFPEAFYGVYNGGSRNLNIKETFRLAVKNDSHVDPDFQLQVPQIISQIDPSDVFLLYRDSS